MVFQLCQDKSVTVSLKSIYILFPFPLLFLLRVPEVLGLKVSNRRIQLPPLTHSQQFTWLLSQSFIEHYRCFAHCSVITNVCFLSNKSKIFFFSHPDSRVNKTAQHPCSHLINLHVMRPWVMLSPTPAQCIPAQHIWTSVKALGTVTVWKRRLCCFYLQKE